MREIKILKIGILCLMLVSVSILFSGCTEGVGKKAGMYNFKQGVGELRLNFLNNAPPEKIYPHSNFKIVVEVDNQAAYDVNNGLVYISGLDDKYFYVTPIEQYFDTLMGKSIISPSGEKTFLEFSGISGDLFANAEQYTANYYLKAKYSSQMEFADTICINPNLYEVYDSGCEVQDRKSYSGQGAPLAVVELEEVMYPGSGAEVEFRLKLSNRGRGKVKTVSFNQAKLGGEDISCEFMEEIVSPRTVRFKDDEQETILICRKQFIRSKGSYTTTLYLNFNYDYEYEEMHTLNLVR